MGVVPRFKVKFEIGWDGDSVGDCADGGGAPRFGVAAIMADAAPKKGSHTSDHTGFDVDDRAARLNGC